MAGIGSSMMTGMDALQMKLLQAPREAVLRFIVSGIHSLTIQARSFYEEADSSSQLLDINEAIHRLSGHLRDLIDAQEPLSSSRIAGITANLTLMPVGELARIEERYL